MNIKLKFETKLLIGLTLIIGLLILIVSIGFYRYFASIISEKDRSTAHQLAEQFTTQVETLFRQVDSSAIVLVNNGSLRDSVISLYNNSPVSDEQMLQYEDQINKNLLPISYAFPFDFKTTLFNNDKKFYFASGVVVTEQDTINARLNNGDWYHTLIEPGEQRSISSPHPDEWSTNPRPVISIYRKMVTQYFDDYATLEIQIPYKKLAQMLNVNLAQPSDFLIVLDQRGNLVFPISEGSTFSEKTFPKIKANVQLLSQLKDSGSVKLANHPYIYELKKSDFSGWSTIYFSSQEATNRSLGFYRNMTILVGFGVWLVLLSAVFILLNRLTKSLKGLVQNVRSVRLNNMSLGEFQGNDDEFHMLNEEFNKMFAKLKESIGEVYESKIRESDAQRMALQAQINPHFLYNTLNAISAAGEQYGSHVVTKMCSQLADMMRYSTSSKEPYLSLKEEIAHVTNYLELVSIPYEGLLTYEIDIPHELESVILPRLSLQPIVENSVNHGFEFAPPPWKIKIYAQRVHNDWCIMLEDNGPGFEESTLHTLVQNLKIYQTNLGSGKSVEPLSLGGMGLLNVYMRLFIQYKDSAVFQIENLEAGGCRVTIGGIVAGEGDLL
jgi:two-component system, sensor histidine kinase YesM